MKIYNSSSTAAGNGEQVRIHAEAQITFLRTEEGGRKSPVRSGYRPQFRYAGADWDAVQEYLGADWVNPGDVVTARLIFFRPEFHRGRIAPGMPFEIAEGSRVVGRGVITRVYDF